MKLITRDTDYSIRVLKYLVNKKNYFATTDEVRKVLKIPYAFLRKIIRLLGKGDFLISFKGINGGIKLNKKPENIKLIDIVETFQGTFKMNECKFKGYPCPERNKCNLRKKLLEIENMVRNEFNKLKLSDIL